MACSVCGKKGHVKPRCPVLEEKETKKRAEILEAINAGAALLQVPIVTAGVWFLLSRQNPTLGVLNKAILAAELTPIIGDIKFPEGVVLGASIESLEDLLKMMEGAGVKLPALPDLPVPGDVAIAPVKYLLDTFFYDPIQAFTTGKFGVSFSEAELKARSDLRGRALAHRGQKNYQRFLVLYRDQGMTVEGASLQIIKEQGL